MGPELDRELGKIPRFLPLRSGFMPFGRGNAFRLHAFAIEWPAALVTGGEGRT